MRPCIVKIWLYWSAFRSVPSGCASCARISSASRPPMMKNANAVTPYISPIFLWSTVVNQLQKPVSRRGTTDAPGPLRRHASRSPSYRASLTSGSAGRPPARRSRSVGQVVVGHLRAELHGVRIAQPRRRAPRVVDRRPKSHPAKHCVRWDRRSASGSGPPLLAGVVPPIAWQAMHCPGRPRAGSRNRSIPCCGERDRSASAARRFWFATHASQSLWAERHDPELHLAVLQAAELRALARSRCPGSSACEHDVVRPPGHHVLLAERAAGPRTSGSPRSRPALGVAADQSADRLQIAGTPARPAGITMTSATVIGPLRAVAGLHVGVRVLEPPPPLVALHRDVERVRAAACAPDPR